MRADTRARRRVSCAGFSAVEMMIAAVALVIMSAGIAGVTRMARRSLEANATLHATHVKGKRTLEKLERQLRSASWASLQAVMPGGEQPLSLEDALELLPPSSEPPSVDNLLFQNFAIDPAAPDDLPVLSDVHELRLDPASEDPENGLDDDGDGFVDESVLVWIPPDEPPVVVCRDVLAFGCGVDGRALRFELRLGVTRGDKTTFVQTTSMSVEIRND